MGSARLIVTIPEEDFKRLEKEKKQKKISRSKYVQQIIEYFFKKEDEAEKEAQYIAGYRKKPEKVREIAAAEEAEAEVLGEF